MTEAEHEEQLAEAVEAYLELLRSGQAPPLREYAAGVPECEKELLELLPTLADMEQISADSAPARAAAQVHFPEELGGYRLLEKIGSGGMGVVFRAVQESLHREVAVKILSPAWNREERQLRAFENESRLIAGLRHTNIVEVFGAGQEGDYRYYVMGLVHGSGVSAKRLQQVYAGETYERAVARVGLQAAKALAFAHRHGVLHRDVKPGNLLLDDEGVLHVSDFGLATVLNSGEGAPLVTQSHDGTLRYMPPERLARGVNSFAGDQYSLGLTLYELITRRPAFRETEPGSLVHRICAEPLPPLRGEGELGAIINKSISFHEQDRYPSMAAMAEDLSRFLSGEPVAARPASVLRRYVMWMRRRPAVALWSHAAGLLVVLLLASISIGFWRVNRSLTGENAQRLRAEKNAAIADAAIHRIFQGLLGKDAGMPRDVLASLTREDARLMQDLLPYYEQIVAQAEEGDGDDKVAQACRVLAAIAQQTGDYAAAEHYYRRAAAGPAADDAARLRCRNGLAEALLRQNDKKKTAEARDILRRAVAAGDVPGATFDTRLETVQSLQLLAHSCGGASPLPRPGHPRRAAARYWQTHDRAASGTRPTFGPKGKGRRPASANDANKERSDYIKRADGILSALLDEQPDNLSVQAQRLSLLADTPQPELQKLLLPEGETAFSLAESLLAKDEGNELLQRLFLSIVTAPAPPEDSTDTVHLAKAARIAGKLVADYPADADLILQYIIIRDRYADALARAGQRDKAAAEGERTLGVLSLLTAREDFSPELRERLAFLVALHPEQDESRTRREEELELLLQTYDDKRRRALRRRLDAARRLSPHRPR